MMRPTLTIGPYRLPNSLSLAPMAGVTDRVFRQLCRELGAGYTVSEMLSCDLSLLNTAKSLFRRDHRGEPEPVTVQIAGAEPAALAEAARFNVANGAQIIDINMGCPAKKVCRKLCGSALLGDPVLVNEILHAVAEAVSVPVTLKIRSGPDENTINAPLIGELAEKNGLAALFIHGRTRTQKFTGRADYGIIAETCQQLHIPVIANGDIDSPQKAARVLQTTGCAGLMIGRAAQGNPWIFREINHFLNTGRELPRPSRREILRIMQRHVIALHDFYGAERGYRIARKHIGWYLQPMGLGAIAQRLNRIDDATKQLQFIHSLTHQKAA